MCGIWAGQFKSVLFYLFSNKLHVPQLNTSIQVCCFFQLKRVEKMLQLSIQIIWMDSASDFFQ